MSNSCIVCGENTKKKCSGCKKVFYCSIEHQRDHWLAGHNKDCKTKQTQEKEAVPMPEAEVGTSNQRETPVFWTPAPTPESCERNGEGREREGAQQSGAAENGVPVVTTPSTVNQNGEPSTLLRPDMAKSYYDGALLALEHTERLRLPTEFNGKTDNNTEGNHLFHPNADQALKDFVRVRRDIVTYTGASAGMKLAQGTLSTGQMMRNGTTAAKSLLRGSEAEQATTRDQRMAEIFERMEEALPTDVPMAFLCGFADTTMEMQMFLRDLSVERNHSEPLVVSAVATCSVSYIVAQDRIRAKLQKHRVGAQEHPEVLEALDQLERTRNHQSRS